MSRRYANPPIAEAVCEFRLSANTEWDLTVPGLIYERMSRDLPKRQEQLFQEVASTREEEGLRQQIQISQHVRFLSDDGRRFVTVGGRLLAVHRLRPYPTWARFRPDIESAFSALRDAVDVAGLQRIGLRYLNQIEIPGARVNLDEFFEFRPFLGERLPQRMTRFTLGCSLPYFHERDVCKVQLSDTKANEPAASAFLLDPDYFLNEPQSVAPDDALDWIETAHDNLEELFEGCISDPLRELFGEA